MVTPKHPIFMYPYHPGESSPTVEPASNTPVPGVALTANR